MRRLPLIVCCLMVVSLCSPALAQELTPVNLRCEYRVNPLGIDETAPRLSWQLESARPAERGQKQSAYQVLVASSLQRLEANEGDLWDSGKVASDATNQIVYAGKPLAARQTCWWKVRTWNGRGEVSNWSEPARWSIGLLEPSDWRAQWVGFDEPPLETSNAQKEAELTPDGLNWLWHSAEAPDEPKAGDFESRYFRGSFNLPADRTVKQAVFLMTADERFELYINGAEAGQGTNWTQIYEVDVQEHLQPGHNVVAVHARNTPGTPGALVGRLRIGFEEGDSMIVDLDGTWKVTAEAASGWQNPGFDAAAWGNATTIARVGDAPWGVPSKPTLTLPPPPQLRSTFTSNKPVRRATMYATALGLYEMHLNGQRIGKNYFTPGWTDYDKRVYYNTYDVTDLLRDGENVLAALLGDGWYAGYVGWGLRREIWGNQPRLRAQLEIEYEDGSTKTIVTDDSWKAAYGPVREADLLMGTAYDARHESDWRGVGFDDSDWSPVVVGSDFEGLVEAYPGAPVRRQETIPAVTMTEPRPGVYVFDLGQNMVGWVRLKAIGKEGQQVTIRHAEMLDETGNLYTVALRGARSTDYYTPAADGLFEFEPAFTFHGFQYVEVSGLDAPPTLEAVTGIVANADMQRTGHLETSNPLVNQLVHNIIWGQKGNYLEVPTDCPQRDERLGWTGDAQFFARTAGYNFDVAAFFTKWLVDLNQDSQSPEGAYASVAPDIMDFGNAGATAWADAGIVCPYTIWKFYNDTRIIEQHWDSMVRYLDYLERTSDGLVRTQGAYGDWLNLGGGAKSEVIGTSYFAHVAELMSEMATAIGKEEEAKKYASLSNSIRAVFIENFVREDGSIEESSQTGYALAFTMDLLPQRVRDEAAERFAEELAKHDWHLATGFIGTPRLLPALTEAGLNDLAYRLLLTETYPSWLFQVTLGATTMWERWDGWTPEKGFQDPGMNSFNHYAFGSVGEWLYGVAGGIQTDGPGFRRILIRPQPGPGLTSTSARYDSINGTIACDWRIEGDKLSMTIVIPPNTTATVHVPAADANTVAESGKPASEADGVTFVRSETDAVIFEIGSGTYKFTAPVIEQAATTQR